MSKMEVSSVDNYLLNLSQAILRQLTRFWIGTKSNNIKKEDALELVRKKFGDASELARFVETLSEFERAGLSLLKLRGSSTALPMELAGELMMLGYDFKVSVTHNEYRESRIFSAANHLINRGLLYRSDGKSTDMDNQSLPDHIGADPRILAQLSPLPPKKLNIAGTARNGAEIVKQPAEVLLNMITFGQALKKVESLSINYRGLLDKSTLARLSKQLPQFKTEKSSFATLAEPVEFYIYLWLAAGLLTKNSSRQLMIIDRQQTELLEQPLISQTTAWLNAYRRMTNWVEMGTKDYSYNEYPGRLTKVNYLRSDLIVALAALPEASDWYRIDDLSNAIFKRVGKYFRLLDRYGFYQYRNRDESDVAFNQRMDAELDRLWRINEQNWIEKMITGPLHHLGLVDLGYETSKNNGTPKLFRLSQLGRVVCCDLFYPQTESQPFTQLDETNCWVVQPNFDVVVYLDSASPSQLSFIEQIGVRKQISGATGNYQLTRDSIYQALENGWAVDKVIGLLKAGSRYPLPDSMLRTINEWAQRRERIAVYNNSRVLEFADITARDHALQQGEIKGTALGERFVLVESIPKSFKLKTTIDYHPQPPRSLTINEDGSIMVDSTSRDLLIEGELSAFAQQDNKNPNRWQITRDSVKRALAAGWTLPDIIRGLRDRSNKLTVPPLLIKVIQAWSGQAKPRSITVSMPKVTILQVLDLDLAQAISDSKLLKKYFDYQMGINNFLIKPTLIDELRDRLSELGFVVGEDVVIKNSVEVE